MSPITPGRTATTKATFTYDAKNRCVLRQYYTQDANGVWLPDTANSVVLTYDTQWNILTDRNLSGRQTANYINGTRTDEILAQVRDSGQYYPLADVNNSTIALADQNGSSAAVWHYTAFGKAYGVSGAASDYRYLFTGREWLALAGIQENRNRYYNPDTGRWLSRDSLYFSDSFNLYAYSCNSPIDLSDPFGTSCSEILLNMLLNGESIGGEDPLNDTPGNSSNGGTGNATPDTIDNTIRAMNSDLKKKLCDTFLDPNNDIYNGQTIYDKDVNGGFPSGSEISVDFQQEYLVTQGVYGSELGKLIEKKGPLIYIPDNYNGSNGWEYDDVHNDVTGFYGEPGSLTLFQVTPPRILSNKRSLDGSSYLNLTAVYQFHSHPNHPLSGGVLSKADMDSLNKLFSATPTLGGAFNGISDEFSGYYNGQQFTRTFDQMRNLLGCSSQTTP